MKVFYCRANIPLLEALDIQLQVWYNMFWRCAGQRLWYKKNRAVQFWWLKFRNMHMTSSMYAVVFWIYFFITYQKKKNVCIQAKMCLQDCILSYLYKEFSILWLAFDFLPPPPQFPVAKCCKTCTCSCYFRMAFKHCCQWLKIALLMVLLPRHMIFLTENLISLTKLHQFLVCFFHLLRKSAELVSVGMRLICES